MRKCTPREIIKEVPDVQTITLPDHWFDDLSANQSVFVSLYKWMLEKSRVPSENKETLHNRTYVGEKMEMVSRPLSGITHVDLEQLIEKDGVCEFCAENLEETLKLWGVMAVASDEGCVYFIRSEKTHAIKIGFTAGR